MRWLALMALLSACRHHNDGAWTDGGLVSDAAMSTVDLAGFDVCASSSQQITALGADMMFLLDTSYSMDFNLKWVSVSGALETFLGDPRFDGVGVGLQYFPLRQTCQVSDYATPAVPIATLPGAAPALMTSIQAKRMAGGTPTVPAMEGVLQYMQAQAAANPLRKQVVVLATDGTPDDSCPAAADMGLPNSVQSVVNLVQAAANATPPVTTFVVGVGANLTALDAIAAAGGGTPNALLVDTTQNVQQEFGDALDQIRKKALDCEFAIPAPAAGLVIDFTKVNVQLDTGSSADNFIYVGSAAGCAQAPMNGWYYDDAAMPTKVILCDQACDAVRAAPPGYELDVVFGCASLVP